jgi:hypothetical protein
MAKFFFHVRQRDILFEDKFGADFPDLVAAWHWAQQDMRAIVAQQVLVGPMSEQWLEIGDEEGAILASVPFAQSVKLH